MIRLFLILTTTLALTAATLFGQTSQKDTLGSTEYSAKTENLVIKEINFSTSACYGTCPIFDLSINADRSTMYNAIEFNDIKGKFKTTLDTISFNKIIQTINLIALLSLKDDYRIIYTDAPTATLEIKFNNGEVKKISDYGENGTVGLKNLYDQLFALRQTQKWK